MNHEEVHKKVKEALDKHAEDSSIEADPNDMKVGYPHYTAHYLYRVEALGFNLLFVWSGNPLDPVRVSVDGEYNGKAHATFGIPEDTIDRMIPLMVGPMLFAKVCTLWIYTEFVTEIDGIKEDLLRVMKEK